MLILLPFLTRLVRKRWKILTAVNVPTLTAVNMICVKFSESLAIFSKALFGPNFLI